MAVFQRILVPTDFSDSSASAADLAAELARQVGCEVQLVTVVDTRPLMEAYGDESFRYERMEAIRAGARTQIEELAGQRFAGCKVTSEVRDGDPASEILAAVAACGADLIVMGTHGRTGLAHLLIGSVAEKTVRHSPVPVLTVRHG